MNDLDRHLDLGSRQLKTAVVAAPTPAFRSPAPRSKVTAGLAAAVITFAVILPVATLLDSEEPTDVDTTAPAAVTTDFETVVGRFTRAGGVEGFSERRDFVEAAAATSYGMVAVGDHTEMDSEPRAWIARAGGPWSPVDLSSVDLTGVEGLIDVTELDGQLALLALDILESDGDLANRRLLMLTSSDLASWASEEITATEALDLGFTNVVGITVGNASHLQSVSRFGSTLVAIRGSSDSDPESVVTSVDGGHTWESTSAVSVTDLHALYAVAAGPVSVVAASEQLHPATDSEQEIFQAIVLWSRDGEKWEQATIDLSGTTQSRLIDVIAIDGGFLGWGWISTGEATEWARAFWASATGEVWKRVSIPELERNYGHLSYQNGTLTLFATPNLEAGESDNTGALEIWQGSIEVVPSPWPPA